MKEKKKSGMQLGKCRLCLQDVMLIECSHIVPDFFYRNSNMYDKDHKILKVENKLLVEGFYKENKPDDQQTGAFDQYILCNDCEGRLNKFESYASLLIYNRGKCAKGFNENGIELTQCIQVDYTKFKLFALSMLWRASISKHDFFKHVKLSSVNEEELRDMVYTINAKTYKDYPFTMYTFKHYESLPQDFICFFPHKNRFEYECYRLVVDGFVIDYYLDGNLPEFIIENTLKTDNILNVFHMDEMIASNMIGEVLNG